MLPSSASIPASGIAAFANFASRAKAVAIARLPKVRRLATLAAFMQFTDGANHIWGSTERRMGPDILAKLELTPFDGHLIVQQEGVQDAQTAYPKTAVFCAISPAKIGRAHV